MTRASDLAKILSSADVIGDIKGSTINADGDTSSGDNAAIGFTSAEGIIITGQGTTNDVTIKNDADADVIEIPTGTVNVTMAGTLGVTGVVSGAGFTAGNAVLAEAELELLDGLTAGTAIASKVVTTDANIDSSGIRNLTITGELDAATLDISGNVDIDGTLETDAFSIGSTAVTSTAAELNILDGVTSTATELNLLDGVTSTTAELNILDGVTSTAAELNALDGITAVVGELNALDIGSTAVGTAVASKAVILDSNKDYTGIRNLTITGELDAATLDISGAIDVAGTTNLDVVDVDGAANFAVDVTFADGADIITASAGTSNTRVGVNTGNTIASGGNYNVLVGDEAGTALTTGDSNTAVGFEALATEDTQGLNTAIGHQALKTANTTEAGYNTAVGYNAGRLVTTGIKNTLLGSLSGDVLTDADFNVAVGYGTLSEDHKGNGSTAVGAFALEAQEFANSGSTYNTAVGANAGDSITSGVANTITGSEAGDALTDADENTAIGYAALSTDTLGSQSTAIGAGTLSTQNFTSAANSNNTALGFSAGNALTTGNHNVLLGSFAGSGGVGNLLTGLRNILIGHGSGQNNGNDNDNIAIGYETNCQGHANAIVMGSDTDSVASNTFTFGKGNGNDRVSNGFTSNATFARVSDVRYKKEIKDNDDCGLDFINDLRPVTFKWKAKSEINKDLPDYDATKTEADHKEKLYGLIAQEVKEALDKNNITDFGGWEKEKTSGINKVAQAMFIYPLIKAVQELSAQVTTLSAEVKKLKGE